MGICARWAAPVLLSAWLTGVAAAGTVSLNGPDTASPGDTVAIDIVLSPDLNAAYALQGGLTYDPTLLSPLPGQETTAPQGFYAGTPGNTFAGETIPKDADLFRLNGTQGGLLIFGYVKNPGDPAGSPSVTVPPTAARILFRVADGASGSTTLQIAPYSVNGLSLPGMLLGAKDGAPLSFTLEPSHTLTIGSTPTRRPGDTNGDGQVTVEDAVQALQLAGGLAAGHMTSVSNADVWPSGTPDGVVTLQDSVRIWRFVRGWETELR